MEYVLLACGLALLLGYFSVRTLRRPPAKARIFYLTKDRENYVRFRSNPGFTIGKFHRCRKGKDCVWRARH